MAKPITNAKCHPNRLHTARGLCASCYNSWHRKTEKGRAATERNKPRVQEKRRLQRASFKFKLSQAHPDVAEKRRAYMRDYYKRRVKEDPIFKLTKNLRARLKTAMKRGYLTGSAIKDLGCSVEFFKQYLESLFQSGMTWGNHGEWHIDHIIPLASANTLEEASRLCHYTNLQPLWAKDNMRKGDATMTKLNNLNARIANLESIGDYLELRVSNEFDNQFFKVENGTLYLRLSLDTAIRLAEFIDREMDEIVNKKMGVGV